MADNKTIMDELAEKRGKLGEAVAKLVTAFETDTGMVVDRIDVKRMTHTFSDTREKPQNILTGIEIEVDLPY